MKNLDEATERICELKGNLVAMDALLAAVLRQMQPMDRAEVQRNFQGYAEAARTTLLNADISEVSIAAFEQDVARIRSLIQRLEPLPPSPPQRERVVEPLLLAAPRVTTYLGTRALTGASGFFFRRDERLYLVTSRHVLIDEPSRHFPDRIEIEVHDDEFDLSRSTTFSMLLYKDGKAVWHQGSDSGGDIDVGVIEIDRARFVAAPHAFLPRHLGDLRGTAMRIPVGTPLVIVGFPLGFHDGIHHLPVARHAAIASSYGTRFQGKGFFLTDARTHRGSSGGAVLMNARSGSGDDDDALPWTLLGIHSSRMDMGGRDLVADESLGLNCAWYADILMTLTEPTGESTSEPTSEPAGDPVPPVS